jgi:hypothetical protein
MREITKASAAPLLLDGDAKKTELSELRPQFAGKAVGAVDIGGVRRDLLLREVADGVAQHFDVAAKAEIEAGQAVR